jgi:polysaccharide pyruvyl transferase WcaK-like protein
MVMATKHKRSRNAKICLLGASFETGNLGVSALSESSIKVILERWPGAEITFFGSGYEPGQCRLSLGGKEICVRTLPIRFSKNILLPYHFLCFALYGLLAKVLPSGWARETLLGRNPYCKTLYETDFVLDITGGDSFSDIYGTRGFVLGCLRKWLAKVFGKKLVLLPQTYGPFNKRITKLLARHILDYATVVYSRDRRGVNYVKKLLSIEKTDQKVRFVPDVGFVLDSRRPEDANIDLLEKIKAQNRTLVGLNISGLVSRSSNAADNMFNLRVDYLALINSIVELLMEYAGTAVLLIPHVVDSHESDGFRNETTRGRGYEQADDTICRKVYEQTIEKHNNQIFMVQGHYNHNEIKYIIGLCDFFIGSRMHSCIAALSQSIPAVGLAYSKKFAGVFESVGAENLVVDLRQRGQDKILMTIRDAFEKRAAIAEHLRKTIPNVQARILSIFKDFE